MPTTHSHNHQSNEYSGNQPAGSAWSQRLGGALLRRIFDRAKLGNVADTKARDLESYLQASVKAPTLTVESRTGELTTTSSSEEWERVLRQKLALQGEALQHAATLMRNFSEGLEDAFGHARGRTVKSSSPDLYFIRGAQQIIGGGYLTERNAIIVPLEHLEQDASSVKPTREFTVYGDLGHVIFQGTMSDSWYLHGVEEGDHLEYVAEHGATAEAVMGLGYGPQAYNASGLIHDAAQAESHWLNTALDLPRVQQNHGLALGLRHRRDAAALLMPGDSEQDFASFLNRIQQL